MKFKIPTINKEMLIYKWHCYSMQAGIGPAQLAVPVMAQTLGFSSFVVGIVYAVLPLVSILVKPLSGWIADKFKKHKAVLVFWLAITCACHFAIQYIPSEFHPTGDPPPKNQPDSVTFSQYQFYVFIVLMMIAFPGFCFVQTISDTICIAKNAETFGKQRLWCSLGYGSMSLLSGVLIDAVSGSGEEKDYSPAFYLCVFWTAVDIIGLNFFMKVDIPGESQSISLDVWKVMLNVRNVIFLVWCIAMGISMGLTWTFLVWLVEDKAREADMVDSVKTIEGLMVACQTCLGEVTAFFFSSWVLKKIGHGNAISVVLGGIALRFTFYSILQNPWWVLIIEPLQMYYGIFYSAMTAYADRVAPTGTEATVQGIFAAAAEGVGISIGSFLGGLFYDEYGGNTCFAIFAVAFAIMAVMNICIELFYMFHDRKSAATGSTDTLGVKDA